MLFIGAYKMASLWHSYKYISISIASYTWLNKNISIIKHMIVN